MALCLAESLILSKGFDAASQQRTYLDWYYNGHLSSTGECFDIGIGTRIAILAFEKNPANPYAATSNEKSRQGNGSLMRLSPIAVRFFYQNAEAALEYAANSSRTTHGAIQCVDACRYFAALLLGALHGVSKDELLKPHFLPPGLRGDYWKTNPLCAEIEEIVCGSYKVKQPPDIAGTGSVVKSLEAVLWAFYHTGSFRDGLLKVVNLGDDADTTGAIFGQLGGAFYGLSAVPEHWLRNLVLAPLFKQFAAELLHHSKLEKEGATINFSERFSAVHKFYMHLETAWKTVQKRLNPCPSMYRDLESFEKDAQSLRSSYYTAFGDLAEHAGDRDAVWQSFERRFEDKRSLLKLRLR